MALPLGWRITGLFVQVSTYSVWERALEIRRDTPSRSAEPWRPVHEGLVEFRARSLLAVLVLLVFDRDFQPGWPNTLALITRAIVMAPISVVTITIVLVAQYQMCGFQRIILGVCELKLLPLLYYILYSHHVLYSRALGISGIRPLWNPDQTMVELPGIGTSGIDIKLPRFADSSGLNSAACLYRNQIKMPEQDLFVGSNRLFYVRAMNLPNVDIWSALSVGYALIGFYSGYPA